jgi:hypothetical protein
VRVIDGWIVEQDAPRRRIDVVELTRAHGPDEGCNCRASDQQCERQYDVERDHEVLRNARDRSELASTVSELSGITSAAIKGWITPITASVPAVRL